MKSWSVLLFFSLVVIGGALIDMLAAGTGLTGYGAILSVQQVSMTPTLTPGWIGINGQF